MHACALLLIHSPAHPLRSCAVKEGEQLRIMVAQRTERVREVTQCAEGLQRETGIVKVGVVVGEWWPSTLNASVRSHRVRRGCRVRLCVRGSG